MIRKILGDLLGAVSIAALLYAGLFLPLIFE